MPLHDWNELSGWEGVHHFWITHLCQSLKSRLPHEYRAYVGSVPTLGIAAPERPDVAVRQWLPEPPSEPETTTETNGSSEEPLVEVATLTLDPQVAVYVTLHGRLVAAVELISPRNKDRPSARAAYLARYLGYLQEGAHLLLVDVHRRPVSFSFADELERELGITNSPPLPVPLAASYRVGEVAPNGGRMLAVWHRQLRVGTPLPTIPLPLNVHQAIAVDLEATYELAAADAYLT